MNIKYNIIIVLLAMLNPTWIVGYIHHAHRLDSFLLHRGESLPRQHYIQRAITIRIMTIRLSLLEFFFARECFLLVAGLVFPEGLLFGGGDCF
jgi:hypothetical protein